MLNRRGKVREVLLLPGRKLPYRDDRFVASRDQVVTCVCQSQVPKTLADCLPSSDHFSEPTASLCQ